MRSSVLHLVPMLAGMAGAPALAQDAKGVPRLLLDRRLQERPVLLVGIDAANIRYTDSAGLVRNEPIAEYLAILPTRQSRPAPAPQPNPDDRPAPPAALAPISDASDQATPGPVLELTDGQRFAGVVAGAPPAAARTETVAWSHPVLGVLEFKLDQIQRVRLHDGAWAGEQATQNDLLILSNGDRLEGFVESLGQTIRLGPAEGKAAPRDIPLDRVYEVILANAATAPPPQAAVAWLRDGSVVACRIIQTTRQGDLTLSGTLQESEAPDNRDESRPPSGATPIRLDDLLAIEFRASGASLKPLATLTPASQEPLAGRRWTKPAKPLNPDRAILNAADLDLPGPMSITWTLPAGATRFATQAELPRQDWAWGDCELVIAAGTPQGQKELARQRLNADAPSAAIAAALPEGATTLIVRLEPGASGPIQDHVVLHRPLLLIGK